MRALIIDPGKAPQIVRMPDDGQALERWLGGDALLFGWLRNTLPLADESIKKWEARQ